MNNSATLAAVLAVNLSLAPLSHAQGINLAPLVPADLVTSVTELAVGGLLPIVGDLVIGSGLAAPGLSNLGLLKPVTDIVLGGDSLKGLASLYGPLDLLLGPVVSLSSPDGLGGVLIAPMSLLLVPVNPLLEALGGGAAPLNGLAGLLDPINGLLHSDGLLVLP